MFLSLAYVDQCFPSVANWRWAFFLTFLAVKGVVWVFSELPSNDFYLCREISLTTMITLTLMGMGCGLFEVLLNSSCWICLILVKLFVRASLDTLQLFPFYYNFYDSGIQYE